MIKFGWNELALDTGWLRDIQFDSMFIIGITVLALLSGFLVITYPNLFPLILLLDLVFLGYHHVISTFTRLCFDKASFEEYRFLVLYLPILILLGVLFLIKMVGLWIIPTMYLYWQWFHYTRQSYGINQVYRKKAGLQHHESEWLNAAALYSLPLWGILHRSHQAPDSFLFVPIHVIPVPTLLVNLSAIAASIIIAAWILMRLNTWRKSRLPVAHTLYMMSHFTIFYVGYILIDNINFGWLVLNIWHNGQYILFVWMFNNNRFKSGLDPKAYLLSYLSQTSNAPYYFIFCISLSTLVYFAIRGSISLSLTNIMPISLVIFQTVNFHHYVVDSLIWKIRKKPLQQILEINKNFRD